MEVDSTTPPAEGVRLASALNEQAGTLSHCFPMLGRNWQRQSAAIFPSNTFLCCVTFLLEMWVVFLQFVVFVADALHQIKIGQFF